MSSIAYTQKPLQQSFNDEANKRLSLILDENITINDQMQLMMRSRL